MTVSLLRGESLGAMCCSDPDLHGGGTANVLEVPGPASCESAGGMAGYAALCGGTSEADRTGFWDGCDECCAGA